MRVGFTGTREGMSARQRSRLVRLLTYAQSGPGEFHHGDCVGADAQAHDIALAAGWAVIVHPPADPRLRAFCRPGARVAVLEPAPFLDRNRAIVDSCEFLVAAPRSLEPVGGTWRTIEYARRRGRPHEVMPR